MGVDSVPFSMSKRKFRIKRDYVCSVWLLGGERNHPIR